VRLTLKNSIPHTIAIAGGNFPDFAKVPDHFENNFLVISLGKFENDRLGSDQFLKS
jgi:hypothetical protein